MPGAVAPFASPYTAGYKQAYLFLGITYLSTNMRHYVEWPKSYEYPELSQPFHKMSNLKNVIGVVGISRIKIQPPREHSEKFLCSSNCYCMTMQGKSFSNITIYVITLTMKSSLLSLL